MRFLYWFVYLLTLSWCVLTVLCSDVVGTFVTVMLVDDLDDGYVIWLCTVLLEVMLSVYTLCYWMLFAFNRYCIDVLMTTFWGWWECNCGQLVYLLEMYFVIMAWYLIHIFEDNWVPPLVFANCPRSTPTCNCQLDIISSRSL